MKLKRLIKHTFTTSWAVRRLIPGAAGARLARLIAESEGTHRGEVRLIVEGSLDWSAVLRGQSARERAIDLFSEFRFWDTEENTGILIYLLVADRQIEIVADRGIAKLVPQSEWESICREMEDELRAGRYESGLAAGIRRAELLLAEKFPAAKAGNLNELPDTVILL